MPSDLNEAIDKALVALGASLANVLPLIPKCQGRPSESLKGVSEDVRSALRKLEACFKDQVGACVDRYASLLRTPAIKPIDLAMLSAQSGQAYSSDPATHTPLEGIRCAYDQRWEEIDAMVRERVSFDGLSDEHVLKALFATTDEEFLDAIDSVSVMDAEIGELSAARLRHIWKSPDSMPFIKQRVAQVLRYLAFPRYAWKQETLFNELIKMRVYQTLSGCKTILLGSARPVTDYAKKYPGYYLNCPDADYTWTLNRLFLSAAFAFGSDFRVVDRLPMLTEDNLCDVPHYVTRMAELSTPSACTQYLRDGVEPTATMQEVLLLKAQGACLHPSEHGIRINRVAARLGAARSPLESLNSNTSPKAGVASTDRPLRNTKSRSRIYLSDQKSRTSFSLFDGGSSVEMPKRPFYYDEPEKSEAIRASL